MINNKQQQRPNYKQQTTCKVAPSESSATVKVDKISTTIASKTSNDKKMQELRALAFEYVKQIVAKAHELSIATKPEQTTNQRAGSSNILLLDNETRKKHLLESSKLINKHFQEFNSNVTRANNISRGAEKSNKISQPTSRWVPTANIMESALKEEIESSETNNDMLSSDSRQSTQNFARQDHSSSRSRNFHQVFNWHQLVSCFSTCLPETLAMLTRRQAGGRTDAAQKPSAL